MSKIVEGLKYSETHEWVKVEGETAIIGVTDLAKKEMGEITYVDCPDVDDEVEKGSEFGALESVKAASDLFSPVSGTVTEVNEDVVDDPKLVNDDAFENWIIKVQTSDASELDDLMDALDVVAKYLGNAKNEVIFLGDNIHTTDFGFLQKERTIRQS